MARVTVEDCLDFVENRFELVLAATKRARQLSNGADAKVEWDGDKPTVVALREIAEQKIDPKNIESYAPVRSAAALAEESSSAE